ncbi:MAG: ferritin [Nitrospirae bacterium]|nr:ferritin [Nitrospirota bacterium]
MATKKDLIDALNKDLGLELGAVTQYMWHHVMAKGPESATINKIFREISIVEMKHAEAFAERIVYLGGTPTTKPAEIKMGGDLKNMMEDDLAGERNAIRVYSSHVKLAEELGDMVTRRMLEDIIKDEQGHDDRWSTILGIKSLAEEE